MLSPAEVDQRLAALVSLLPAEDCPLAQAAGRVLRRAVTADRDFPPFDRVTMDGYALASGSDATVWTCEAFQPAGSPPLTLRDPASGCVEVATGAMLPRGCDTVVPYEAVEREGSRVVLRDLAAKRAGACIHFSGTDARRGTPLLSVGQRLGARELAVAASCGAVQLRVSARPSVALVSTGDELVGVEHPAPAPHQLRRSNDTALRSALHAAGLPVVESLHLRDAKYELEHQLGRLLSEFDAVLITGGVSRGRLDLIPDVLTVLGVEKHVAGVSQRPGKPFWFGLTSRRTPVFALPGNPVSAYTCFHRYALPYLRRLQGETLPTPLALPLGEAFALGAPLTSLLPVRIAPDAEGRPAAFTVRPNTSGDLTSLVGTSGFLELPPSATPWPVGTLGTFFPWPDQLAAL